MIDNPESSSTLKSTVTTMLIVGGLLVLGAVFAARASALAVATGVAVAVVHLLAVAYSVTRALSGARLSIPWVLASLLKLLVLFACLAWLAHSRLLPLLPFLLGYATLPLGILLTGLTTLQIKTNPNPKPSRGSADR